jgi:hypothetical protein
MPHTVQVKILMFMYQLQYKFFFYISRLWFPLFYVFLFCLKFVNIGFASTRVLPHLMFLWAIVNYFFRNKVFYEFLFIKCGVHVLKDQAFLGKVLSALFIFAFLWYIIKC